MDGFEWGGTEIHRRLQRRRATSGSSNRCRMNPGKGQLLINRPPQTTRSVAHHTMRWNPFGNEIRWRLLRFAGLSKSTWGPSSRHCASSPITVAAIPPRP